EDRTVEACTAEGGTPAAASSCLPNPCADVPPPAQDIICCVPDDSGPECEDRTPEQCAAQGGINMGPGSCTPNPCAATSAPANESGDDHGGGESGHGRHGGGSDDRGGNRPYYLQADV